jgi:hypothetical protein
MYHAITHFTISGVNFLVRSNRINPSGKSPNPVKPLNQKYSAFQKHQISCIFSAVPSRQEGRIAIVTDAGRDVMDAGGASRRTALIPPSAERQWKGTKPTEVFGAGGRGRPKRVVLTPQGWRQVLRSDDPLKATVTNNP